jgi:hypothetical protein
VLSALIGWVLLAAVWRSRRIVVLPILLIGVVSGIMHGVYLTVDCLMGAGGDGTRLAELNTPQPLIVAAGAAMTAIGIACMIARIELLGLARSDNAAIRALTLLAGGASYLAAIFVYHFLFNRNELGLWGVYAGAGVSSS